MIQHFIIIIQLKERHTSGSLTMDSFNLDPDAAEQHLEKQVKHILGDKYEEEADNFDPDFDPPPTALPDPDEYSDEEIPEDELRELQLESEATLDLDDLRRKLREAKLQ